MLLYQNPDYASTSPDPTGMQSSRLSKIYNKYNNPVADVSSPRLNNQQNMVSPSPLPVGPLVKAMLGTGTNYLVAEYIIAHGDKFIHHSCYVVEVLSDETFVRRVLILTENALYKISQSATETGLFFNARVPLRDVSQIIVRDEAPARLDISFSGMRFGIIDQHLFTLSFGSEFDLRREFLVVIGTVHSEVPILHRHGKQFNNPLIGPNIHVEEDVQRDEKVEDVNVMVQEQPQEEHVNFSSEPKTNENKCRRPSFDKNASFDKDVSLEQYRDEEEEEDLLQGDGGKERNASMSYDGGHRESLGSVFRRSNYDRNASYSPEQCFLKDIEPDISYLRSLLHDTVSIQLRATTMSEILVRDFPSNPFPTSQYSESGRSLSIQITEQEEERRRVRSALEQMEVRIAQNVALEAQKMQDRKVENAEQEKKNKLSLKASLLKGGSKQLPFSKKGSRHPRSHHRDQMENEFLSDSGESFLEHDNETRRHHRHRPRDKEVFNRAYPHYQRWRQTGGLLSRTPDWRLEDSDRLIQLLNKIYESVENKNGYVGLRIADVLGLVTRERHLGIVHFGLKTHSKPKVGANGSSTTRTKSPRTRLRKTSQVNLSTPLHQSSETPSFQQSNIFQNRHQEKSSTTVVRPFRLSSGVGLYRKDLTQIVESFASKVNLEGDKHREEMHKIRSYYTKK